MWLAKTVLQIIQWGYI